MRRFVPIALVALVVIAAVPAAFAATITLNGAGTSRVYVYASNGDGSFPSGCCAYPVTLPTSGSLTSVDGGSSSTTTYDLSNAGFNFTFDQVRDLAFNSFADSQGPIFFSPSTNVGYVVSGAYASSATDGRWTNLHTLIMDYTTSTILFQSQQVSQATPGESFILGQMGGDSYNTLSGSLAGTLIAGHQYQLEFAYQIVSSPSAASASASATGYLNIAFVPEPPIALLCGLGLAGLAAGSRRHA